MANHRWQTSPELGQRLRPLAQQMRQAPTGAEAKLWQHIRKRQIRGARFRRQHAIDRFIPDFCCLELRLLIELHCGCDETRRSTLPRMLGSHSEQSIDGPIHQSTKEEDQIRQEFLERQGYEVLRFANMDCGCDENPRFYLAKTPVLIQS